MPEYNETLSIYNICGGAVEERFQREVIELLKNINDLNTPADQKRTVTLEFQFDPFPDRSGAGVKLICKSKMAAIEPVDGSIYFSKSGSVVKAYAHDPRQSQMFGTEDSINKRSKTQ